MSIYATGHELALAVYVPCAPEEKDAEQWGLDDDSTLPGTPVMKRWIDVWCQHVPNHINEENGYGGEGWEWLPAFVHQPDCARSEDPYWFIRDPEVRWVARSANEDTPGAEQEVERSCSCGSRAVFIIDEDHHEKDGQRYTDPLLVLTGAEYNAATFDDLLSRISNALEERFGATCRAAIEEAPNA